MANGAVAVTDREEPKREYSEVRRILGVFFRRKVSVFGLVVIVAVIVMGIFAPLIAPYDPLESDLDLVTQNPSRDHLLGTDAVGRDVLSRIIFGTRTSLMVGLVALIVGAFIGQVLGLAAAYFGGRFESLVMRVIDAIMSIPPLLSAMVIAAVLGGGLLNLIIALAFSEIPVQARLMSAQVLTVKQNDYILASRARGASNLLIMLRHIVPNAYPPLLVAMTVDLGMLILAEAGLSFLGIGINPPTPSWGGMVSEGYKYIFDYPTLAIAPGVAIMLTVFAFSMVGDGLRDALDPRLRGVV
jgi:ABC-type dipeptide/oligopeptide/nickel transport system permease subunit